MLVWGTAVVAQAQSMPNLSIRARQNHLMPAGHCTKVAARGR